jgi:hypothetical protein
MVFWLLFQGCFPVFFPREFVDNPRHDFDGDDLTEEQGDCDDNDKTVGVKQDWYADADSDGYGNEAYVLTMCFPPEGYIAPRFDSDGELLFDCDDENRLVFPYAAEVCDRVDNDCDALIDYADPDILNEGYWYRDADGDGYGNPELVIIECDPQQGYVQGEEDLAVEYQDCDDSNPLINPSQMEYCDGLDNNCDGDIDDADIDDVLPDRTWYIDEDGDGHGSLISDSTPIISCSQPQGYSGTNEDCNDSDASVFPGSLEVCDGIDQNCNTLIDEGTTVDWYADEDGDGYGVDPDTTASIQACEDSFPIGYVRNTDDCNDSILPVPNGNPIGALAYPNATEYCDGIDNDCNGLTDDNAVDVLNWYMDNDRDGYGDVGVMSQACTAPSNYVNNADDCDDTNEFRNPLAIEDCDTDYDDDCNGSSNDVNAISCSPFYMDSDGDEYGEANNTQCLCSADIISGYSSEYPLDCDDTDPDINPAELENCQTAYDDNCDGSETAINASFCTYFYEDIDDDEWGTITRLCMCEPDGHFTALVGGDCNDGNSYQNPGEIEVCDSADIDEDCDGTADGALADGAVWWYADVDNDGYGDPVPKTLVDQRTSPVMQCDAPNGFVIDASDCDDVQGAINPSMQETCATTFDDNCDGNDNDDNATGCVNWYADADGDGFGSDSDVRCLCDNEGYHTETTGTDCADGDAAVNPDQTELCATTVDDNCDGQINEYDASDCTQYFLDLDGDGWGIYDMICSCAPDTSHTAVLMGDCNDEPSNNGASQNPDLGNCGLSGAFTIYDAVATLDVNHTLLDWNFDYNNDGFSDVLIGNVNYDNAYSNAGSAQIIFGPLQGELGDPNNASLFFAPNVTYDEYAGLYGTVADIDADGAAEILIGSWNNLYQFSDSMALTQPFDDSVAELIVSIPASEYSLTSSNYLAEFSPIPSTKLARNLGDIDGDGGDEVLFGHTNLSVEMGSVQDTYANISLFENRVHWSSSDLNDLSTQTKWEVAPQSCDLNGDGILDWVAEYRIDSGGHGLGTPWYAPTNQRLEIYDGANLNSSMTTINPEATLLLIEQWNSIIYFGLDDEVDSSTYGSGAWRGARCVGDVTGDGNNDIAVSKRTMQMISDPDPFTGLVTTSVNYGAVKIWTGGTMPDSSWAIEDFDTTIIGSEEWEFFGTHLSDPVDLNGDGVHDLVIGGGQYGFEGSTSHLYQLSYQGGSTNNYSNLWLSKTNVFYGGQVLESGTYLSSDADGFIDNYHAPIQSAGDTNGDGADDLWIGTLLFLGTPF